ncbi:MAG: hypothetical protein WHU93_01345 [Arcobacteraceae bacterium]
MKFNKQIAIILVLGSFLLSAIGAAYYFYSAHNKTVVQMSQKVKVYVVNKSVKSGHQFGEKDLKEHFITKQELLTKPLSSGEIIGKYAKVDMFENEMIIKDKISDTLEQKEEDLIKSDFKNNSYNMGFRMFNNPNYTLKKGDIISIVSTYPITADKLTQYSVQYVAKDVEVLGFILLGKPVAQVFNRQKVTKIVNKKEIEVEEDIKADEIVLDIKSDVLLNLINDYNRGNQLWMVKRNSTKGDETSTVVADSTKTSEEQKVDGKLNDILQVDNKSKTIVKTDYKYRWYVTSNIANSKTATVEYADTKVVHSETVKVASNSAQKCTDNKDNFIVVTGGSVYLRSGPDMNSKSRFVVYKKNIIPFEERVGDWYKTCDGLYIHSKYVSEISYDEAVKKVNENK